MAQLFWLLTLGLAVTARLTWAGLPIIRLINQGGPIIEGTNVTLECLSDEDGEDLSGFTFQKYSKWLHSWINLDEAAELRCWFYDVTVSHNEGRLLLTISDLESWHTGLYRCATPSNDTENGTFSNELDLQREFLHSIFLSRTNSWCGTVGESVRVLEGSNLELQCLAGASQPPIYEWTREGSDWIIASSTLTFNKVTRDQSGTYTCQAHHPTLPQLSKNKSVNIFVEGSERGFTFETLHSFSPLLLSMVVVLPAMLLLVLIGVFAVLIPRQRAAAKKKAAQQDAGQRTPIYKGSLESVPSIVTDTHPLVM